MVNKYDRSEHLGWIEAALRSANPDLPDLMISAQVHYGAPGRIAFVNVVGVDSDPERRRQIRADASDTLRRLGYVVEIEPGRDVYDIMPDRERSAHEALEMLSYLEAALKPRQTD